MKYGSNATVLGRLRVRAVSPTILLGCMLVIGSANAESSDRQPSAQNPNQMRLPVRSSDANDDAKNTESRTDFRSVDGAGNNLANRSWGRADLAFLRLTTHDYADGKSAIAGASRVSPRRISNTVHNAATAGASFGSPKGAAVSDMFWQWGQFLDHDLTLTPEIEPAERADISIPRADPWFDRDAAGNKSMPFSRSAYSVDSRGVRQQHNAITAYIDASNVYGSDAVRARALRTNDGTGRLKVSGGNLLPFNTAGLPNAPNTSRAFFLAGDFRANEQVGLTALHTLFVREHNRIAAELRGNDSSLNGEEVYQQARALVGALMQVITYKEFLTELLGESWSTPYQGYKAGINASVSNEFAAAAFRVGHTMLSSQILRVNANGSESSEGHIRLQDAFFKPQEITQYGIESLLRGLTKQRAQKIDVQIVDDVRNLLFGSPGAGGLDLAALNIQRGRDHGLASYAATRSSLGLGSVTQVSDITADTRVQNNLRAVYADVNDIDLWVGGLAEPAVSGAMIGETFHRILSNQFRRLRDGDRFWYTNHFSASTVQWLESQTLAKVIRRNTQIGNEISDHVFKVNPAMPVGAIILLLLE